MIIAWCLLGATSAIFADPHAGDSEDDLDIVGVGKFFGRTPASPTRPAAPSSTPAEAPKLDLKSVKSRYMRSCLERTPIGKKIPIAGKYGLDFQLERVPQGFKVNYTLGIGLRRLPSDKQSFAMNLLDRFVKTVFKPYFAQYGLILNGKHEERGTEHCNARNCINLGLDGTRGPTFNSRFWNVLSINGVAKGFKVMANLCLHEFMHLFGAEDHYDTRLARADDLMTDVYDAKKEYILYPDTLQAMFGQACGPAGTSTTGARIAKN